jgi:hypothetical protein
MSEQHAEGGPAGPPPAGDGEHSREQPPPAGGREQPPPTGGREQPPPANGWEAPQSDPEPDPFAALGRALLAAIPPELLAAVARAVKQLLAALRRLLEWLIARLRGPRPDSEPPTVRDIPIE